jgi:hypothetical protein
MRAPRFSIAGLLGLVLVSSIGLAALRYASAVWAGVMFLLTCGLLGLAILGVACRQGADRVWWLGFAVFGWGYLILIFVLSPESEFGPAPGLPPIVLLDALKTRIGPVYRSTEEHVIWDASFYEVGHCLLAQLAALLGGVLGRSLFGATRAAEPPPVAGSSATEPASRRPRAWRRRLAIAIAVVVGFGLLWLGARSAAGAGAVYLLTCGLLCLTVLGVAGSRGRRRLAWLGAGVFGWGYLVLAFNSALVPDAWSSIQWNGFPPLVTTSLLEGLRNDVPLFRRVLPAPSNGADANAAILAALNRPFRLRFPEDTPIKDVLKSIRTGTRSRELPNGILFYLDPVSLQENEKTDSSPVKIELEGVPLKVGLRFVLRQLGFQYAVRGGVVHIHTVDESSGLPDDPDPFLRAGHCLFAILAAGLGAAAGRLVHEKRGERAS